MISAARQAMSVNFVLITFACFANVGHLRPSF